MRNSTLWAVTVSGVNSSPEFLRTEAVQQLFGIKRGTLYNLFKARKVKGALLRRQGNVTGVRVWEVQSIRDYIRAQIDEAAVEHNPADVIQTRTE